MNRIVSLGVLALAAALAACSGSAKLTVSSQATPGAAATASPPAAACPAGDVTLEEVWMVVRHVEIEGGDLCAPPATTMPTVARLRTAADHGSCEDGVTATSEDGGTCEGEDDDHDGSCRDGDGDGIEDDCEDGDGECEMEVGPFAVVLSAADLASGTVSHEFDVSVPPGDYDELEILVNTIPASKAGDDAVLQEMAAAHASVRVRGKVAGEDFTWETNVAFKQETEPFTIPAAGGNVTLQLDTSAWFVNPQTCEPLDPRDPMDRTQIARNIRASFRMLHDDDRDGHDDGDDDGRHGGEGFHR